MKILRFQEADTQAMNLIPFGVQDQMADMSDGRGLRKIGVMIQGYHRQRDTNEWTRLRVRQEDLGDCLQALSWTCTDNLDFVFTPVKTPNSSIAEVHIPGRFVPALTIEDITQMVKDYRLLSGVYTRRQDIFLPSSNEKLSTILFNYLLDKTDGKKAECPAWVKRAMEIKKENQKEKS